MIFNKNNSNIFHAVSFNTVTFSNLHFYMEQSGFEITRIDPEQFISGLFDKSANYINLVTQDMNVRKQVSKTLDDHLLNRFSFVHSSSVIDGAEIGTGSFVYPLTVLYHNSVLGNDNIVHSHCALAYKSITGTGCHISGGVIIGGSTTIGDYCTFGISVTVYDKINIVSDSNFGARTIIRKNITQPGTYGFGQNNKLLRIR